MAEIEDSAGTSVAQRATGVRGLALGLFQTVLLSLLVGVSGVVLFVVVRGLVRSHLKAGQDDQWVSDLVALAVSLAATYLLSVKAAHVQVQEKAAATGRSALRRVFQANTGIKQAVDSTLARLDQLSVESAALQKKVDPKLVNEWLTDIHHQLFLIRDALVYAKDDWKDILAQDIERQERRVEEYSRAEGEIARLMIEIDEKSAKLAEVESQLAQEQEVSARALEAKGNLEKEIRHREAQVVEQTEKASAAARKSPFPITASMLATEAGLPASRLLASGLTLSLVRQLVFDYVQTHQSATPAEVREYLGGRGYSSFSIEQIRTLLSDPTIRLLRTPPSV